LLTYPLCIASVSATALLARCFCLIAVVGGVKAAAGAFLMSVIRLAVWFGRALSSAENEPRDEDGSLRRKQTRAELLLEGWRSRSTPIARIPPALLALGFLALMGLVVGTGGMVESPFRDVLVATFILGQFRAPTDLGIWVLFALGVATALTTHVVFLWLRHENGTAFAAVDFPARYHVAPGLIVALVTTIIYSKTFSAERETGASESEPQASA
ncbi:MAG: hypothetical protein M3O46_14010, partial [Myxococcota bacterium]|nr:hypothetical protein [Myxococcota bacterium]